jgi:DNA-directed RNA polymerase specialized sigma24 family protein
MSDSSALAPETWVDQHGDALYRFALARVSDPELVADLVLWLTLSSRSSSATWTARPCERFEITAANLAARLYRARLLLRHCLETHGFAETSIPS